MYVKKISLTLILTLLVSSVSLHLPEPVRAEEQNLLSNSGFEQGLTGWNTTAGSILNQNGGFETDLSGWKAGGAVCTWTEGGADGSKGSAFVDVTNGYNDISQTLTFEKGKQYRLSVSLKAAKRPVQDPVSGETVLTDVDTVAQILVSYQNGTDYLKTGTPINSREWTRISTVYTCSADASSVKYGAGKLYVRIGSVPQNQWNYDYYIDEFYCEELAQNATVAIVSGGAEGSAYCAKVTKLSETPIVPSQRAEMKKNNWYVMTAYARLDSGSGTARFGVRHGNGTVDYVGVKTTLQGTGWIPIKAFYQSYDRNTVMAGDVFVSVEGASVYYVDQISVIRQEGLYVNGDFETPNEVSGWKESYKDAAGKAVWGSTAPTWVSTPTHNGSAGAAKVVPKSNNNERTAQFVHLEKNKWYIVSFWVLLEAGSGTSEAQIIRVHIDNDVDTGAAYMAQKTPVNDTGWTEVKAYFQYTGTNQTADCQLFLRIGKNPTTDKISFYFDDFSVVPVQPGAIKLTGETDLILPVSGTKTQQFSAVVTNEVEGQTPEKVVELSNETVEYTFPQALPQGASFADHALTVSSDTPESSLQMKLSLASDPDFYRYVTIHLISERTNLANRIAEAEAFCEEAPETVPGSKERFQLAIDEAKAVLAANPTPTQAHEASELLAAAKKRFEEAVSKDDLIAAKQAAEAVYQNTQTGTASGQCTAAQKTVLRAAIDAAAMVIEGTDISWNQAKDEVIRLNDALFAFRRGLVPYAELYVDPSGGSAQGDGTAQSPFATVEQARSRVREISGNMNSDIVVYLKGGDYGYQQQPLDFDAADSGRNGFYIVYRAPSGEVPVISGGKQVTGWQMYDAAHNIMRAYVGNVSSRQFYVGGVRATRARQDLGDTSGWTYDNGEYGHTAPASFDSLANLSQPSEAELVYYSAWTNPRCKIDSVTTDAETGTLSIKMQQPGWNYIRNKGGSSAKNPWYAENAYEFLDEAGEWYLDSSTGYLYYKPHIGENIGEAETILAVKDSELMRVRGGGADSPVNNILFDGITFSYSTWMRPSTAVGHSDAQNNHLRDATVSGDTLPASAVLVEYGHGIVFSNCEFSHLGITALKMIKCIQDTRITGNRFYDISGGAINLGEPSTGKIDSLYPNNYNYLPANEKYYISRNTISNNYIHDTALEYRSAAAISAGFPIHLEISYNTISDTAYSGMHIGYGWKGIPTSIMKDIRIHHNRILNVMNSKINDGGGVYTIGPTSGTDSAPNLIYENYFQGQNGYGGSVYNDQGSSFWKVERNVSDLSESPMWSNTNKEHRWLNYWSVDNNDMFADENYAAEYQQWEDNGQNNHLGNTYYVTDFNWPQQAQDVIDHSGIQPEYEGLTDYIRGQATVWQTSDSVEGNVRVENKTEQPLPVLVVLAVYQPPDQLWKLRMESMSVLSGISGRIALGVKTEELAPEGDAKAKLMVLGGSELGTSDLMPVCVGKTVVLN